MMKRKLFVGVIALGLSSLALASGDTFTPPAFMPGVYIGAQGGYALTGWNNVDASNPFGKVSGSNAAGARAYLGYDASEYFAIEAGYTQFFNDTKIGITNNNTYNPKYDLAVDLVGKLKTGHIVDNFGLYAKAGVDYMYVNEGLDGKKHDAVNVVYGAGAYYDITQNFTADLSWTRYNGNPAWSNNYIPYADLFALGVSYKFNLA